MNLVHSQHLTLAGIVVHQDPQGRYSLNDLHSAAGGEDRHMPIQFLRLDSTEVLVSEIEKVGNPIFSAVSSVRGCSGRTYVTKELVYAYSNWISPAFYLNVIRTYDALVTGNTVALSELLPQPMMKQVGGMMKAVSRKQMDESIADALYRVLPAMIRAEMSGTHMSVRRGLTAGECWRIHGLPTKGLRGYAKWFSNHLTEIGCLISNGRGELGSSATRLFDPDRVSALMRYGFKQTCERYVRERIGQKTYFAVISSHRENK
ncbi:MAG: KilA-N domain-containing protein [Methylotenera sp.]|nr:KilA-N domain-containing protein [Methylotenera sp.]MDD4926809.1 KilA-N domain-containing protein [Methylotenera sp.]